jgi:ubiquinone/menaquinone biosynthesis C-methylase UbiE
VAEFHFVEDYERLVADLIAKHPIEEAMSLAVGGHYDHIGQIEGHLLRWAGLANGMSVIDLGCGSGRTAHALGKAFAIDYLGVDIVQALLDYAATKSPASYRFVLNRSLTLPADDKSADFVTALPSTQSRVLSSPVGQ